MKAPELLSFADRLAGFAAPPADSCVVFDSGRPIRRALAGINATTGDLMLARQLGCDAFLLHHPLAGAARRGFHRVLDRMVELMTEHGVARERADAAVADLRRRSRFNDHLSDWDHLASAAELIGITLVNVHLAADELGRRVMADAAAGAGAGATLGEVAERLRTIPELAHPANEIILIPAEASKRAGRVAVMHAGGTNGGASVAECLFDHSSGGAGVVETVVYIHIAGDDVKRLEARAAEGKPGSLIVTGHLASDAIGMNLLMGALRCEAGVEVIPGGGLRPFAGCR